MIKKVAIRRFWLSLLCAPETRNIFVWSIIRAEFTRSENYQASQIIAPRAVNLEAVNAQHATCNADLVSGKMESEPPTSVFPLAKGRSIMLRSCLLRGAAPIIIIATESHTTCYTMTSCLILRAYIHQLLSLITSGRCQTSRDIVPPLTCGLWSIIIRTDTSDLQQMRNGVGIA